MINHKHKTFFNGSAHIYSKLGCVSIAVQDLIGVSIVFWSVQFFKVGTRLCFFSKNCHFFTKNLKVDFGSFGGLPEENYEGYFCSLHQFLEFSSKFDQICHIRREFRPMKMQPKAKA